MRMPIALITLLVLAGCGGGGGGSSPAPPASSPSNPSMAQRTAAATATAQGNAYCTAVRPFYWEIGNASQALASGSVNAPSDGNTPVYTASSVMSIASASKWIYAAYVVQKQGGQLSASDVSFLHFTSGYVSFGTCLPGQTVDACANYLNNGVLSPNAVGYFSYGGGHMEQHADRIGLGPLDNAALASEIMSQLGSDVPLAYSQPQLAGGVVTTPAAYAVFLRKMLDGQLRMGGMLGDDAVCTDPATCPSALNTPIPQTESWTYSLGHWVESDPQVGDGAFSSAGAFGFYPWIDASKTWYGILARRDSGGNNDGYVSAQCGRLIRKAWVSGVAP